MKKTTIDTLHASPTEAYKKRVLACKDNLPKNYKELIYKDYPQYDTAKGVVLINNVIAGRTSDINLTEILERIATGNKKRKPTKAI